MSTRASDIRQVVVNTVVAVGGLCLTFRWPIATTVLIALLFAFTTRTWGARRDWFVAAAALVCGVALEMAATRAGLWSYTHVTAAGLPAWVLVLWPTYMIGLPHLAAIVDPGPDRALASPRIAAALGCALVAIEIPLLALLGNTQPVALTAILLALGAAALTCAPSKRAVVVFAASAAFGLMCESMPVLLGIWTYAASGASAMPPWVAPGYGLFGLAVVHLGQGLDGLLRPR